MKSASSKPVVDKLGIKAGNRIAVLNSPKGYTSILAKLPAQVNMTTRLAGEPFDVVQGFYESPAALKAEIRKIRKAIQPWGRVWICWRKGKGALLGRDSIMGLCENAGLDAVGICALNDEWAGLKLMLPKDKRKAAPRRG